ncbi:MAG: malonyl-ACP O-methyltransferase BioC [Acidaminococcaceae bacterium]
MLDKQQVNLHFSRHAQNYDNYAVVQKNMAQKLGEMLQKGRAPETILEIGCGTGNYTRILAEQYPEAQIVATDISPDMLAVTREKLACYPNIVYQVADGECLQLGQTFDLITSNAVFQWFENYEEMFRSYAEHLNVGGRLVYATFGQRTFYELHDAFAQAYAKLDCRKQGIHGPKFATSEELLQASGRSDWESGFTEEDFIQFFPSVKEFLTAVKKVGANNASKSEQRLTNRTLLLQMIKEYEAAYMTEHGIRTTYHVIYARHEKSERSSCADA